MVVSMEVAEVDRGSQCMSIKEVVVRPGTVGVAVRAETVAAEEDLATASLPVTAHPGV